MEKTIGNYITYFRGLDGEDGHHGETWDEEYELLRSVGQQVHEEITGTSRWSYSQETVFKVEHEGEVAYFKVLEEVGATEMQDGYDDYFMYEVEPVEVLAIKYVEVSK